MSTRQPVVNASARRWRVSPALTRQTSVDAAPLWCATDVPVPRALPPAAPAVRHQQGQELHGGRGPLPRLHAAPARLRPRERLRRAAHRRPPGAAVQIRLVHQVAHGHGEGPAPVVRPCFPEPLFFSARLLSCTFSSLCPSFAPPFLAPVLLPCSSSLHPFFPAPLLCVPSLHVLPLYPSHTLRPSFPAPLRTTGVNCCSAMISLPSPVPVVNMGT